jgi:hypothetical protein
VDRALCGAAYTPPFSAQAPKPPVIYKNRAVAKAWCHKNAGGFGGDGFITPNLLAFLALAKACHDSAANPCARQIFGGKI